MRFWVGQMRWCAGLCVALTVLCNLEAEAAGLRYRVPRARHWRGEALVESSIGDVLLGRCYMGCRGGLQAIAIIETLEAVAGKADVE